MIKFSLKGSPKMKRKTIQNIRVVKAENTPYNKEF